MMSLKVTSKKQIQPPIGFQEEPYWEVSLVVDGLYEVRYSAPHEIGVDDAKLQKYLEDRYEDIRKCAFEVLRLRVKDELTEIWKDVKELKMKAGEVETK